MVRHGVERLAVRDLPHHLALVQIERGDATPWRFDERQPLHGESAAGVAAAGAVDVVHVRTLRIVDERDQRGSACSRRRTGSRCRDRTNRPASWRRSARRPCRSCRPSPRTIGGVKSGPSLYCDATFSASALISGVKSIRSFSWTPCSSNGGGLVGNGCVALVFSPGTVLCSTGRSSIGHTGCAGLAIEDVEKSLLGRLRHRLDRPAVHGDVDQDRRARDVVVPDAVVDELIVPDALAGLQFDGEQRFGEQVVAGTMARRSSRRSRARPAGRRDRAPRRPRTAPTRRRCRCRTTSPSPTCRCRTLPACGMVWKIHSRLPVRTSNPRT